MSKGHPKAAPGPHEVCLVCGRRFPKAEMRAHSAVRPGVSRAISVDFPDWGDGRHICQTDLATYRARHVEHLLKTERGELTDLDRQVIESYETGETITRPPEEMIEVDPTFGERMADAVARFGGSWTFILTFAAVLVIWMTVNVTGLLFRSFDPYPFILLNLVLSSLAAIQAPVIMMSQRRQETKDRLRAENDYRVNLKAELEIRQLHEKIDTQMARNWEKLAELQEIQIEVLEDLALQGRKPRS